MTGLLLTWFGITCSSRGFYGSRSLDRQKLAKYAKWHALCKINVFFCVHYKLRGARHTNFADFNFRRNVFAMSVIFPPALSIFLRDFSSDLCRRS